MNKRIKKKYNPSPKHKYIKDLGICLSHTPYGWSNHTGRDDKWRYERELYGFDERETWGIDTTFVYWLYERLMMYDEINIVNTESDLHIFTIHDRKMNLQQCIDEMLKLCKKYISARLNDDETYDTLQEILLIFTNCIMCLWW